jgi:methionyl-tRNA formyltransferase
MNHGKRVVVLGKNDIAVRCLEILESTPDVEIAAVIAHPEDKGIDGWQRSLTKPHTIVG